MNIRTFCGCQIPYLYELYTQTFMWLEATLYIPAPCAGKQKLWAGTDCGSLGIPPAYFHIGVN